MAAKLQAKVGLRGPGGGWPRWGGAAGWGAGMWKTPGLAAPPPRAEPTPAPLSAAELLASGLDLAVPMAILDSGAWDAPWRPAAHPHALSGRSNWGCLLQTEHLPSPPGRLAGIGRLFGRSPTPGHVEAAPAPERRLSLPGGPPYRAVSPSPGSPMAIQRTGSPAGRPAASPFTGSASRLQREHRDSPASGTASPSAGARLQPHWQQQQHGRDSRHASPMVLQAADEVMEAASPGVRLGPAPLAAAAAPGDWATDIDSTPGLAGQAHPAGAAGISSAQRPSGSAPSPAGALRDSASEPQAAAPESNGAETPSLTAAAASGATAMGHPEPAPASGGLLSEVVVVLPWPRKAGMYLAQEGQVKLKNGGTVGVQEWAEGSATWLDAIRLATCENEATGLPEPSGISLRQWHERCMLQRGLCHFCCRRAPESALRHPEYAQLDLCRTCWQLLGPGEWKDPSWWACPVGGELREPAGAAPPIAFWPSRRGLYVCVSEERNAAQWGGNR